LALHEAPGFKFYMAGSPVEQYDFIQLIRRDQMVFLPLITVLLVVTTWIVYRSFSCMVLAMAIVFITLSWSFGTIVFTGQQLNLVTSLLAPVIMIVAVVNSTHLITLFLEIRHRHPVLKDAVLFTMEHAGIPCFFAHFTTFVGFISLVTTPVPAIQSFGIFAALGTFYSYLVEVLLTPILLPMLPSRPKRTENGPNKLEHFFNLFLIGYLEKLEFRWKWWILIGTVATTLLSLLGISKLDVDTSLIKQMKPDTPLAIATRFIDEKVTGVYLLGFVLKRIDGSTMVDYETLNRIDQFKDYLESKPEIAKVNSVTTLVKKINEAREDDSKEYRIPKDRNRLEAYFAGMRKSRDPALWRLITPDFREIRVEARMRAVGTKKGALVEETTQQYMEKELKSYFDYRLTGNVVLLGRMSKDLVNNQIKGFFSAFIAILVLIIIIFRSLKMGFLAIIPNVLPILGVYGVMGFMGIELSSPTAMISSIVLGLVVDETIYFLHTFRSEFSHRRHYIQSLHHTYRQVGQSMVISAVVLMAGFACSIFGSFRPTIYFGVLTSLAVLFALICTLVIVPVCLVILKPFGKERLFIHPVPPSPSFPR
jgi:hypothetical protein